jgi:hypothetical protein
MTSVSLTKSSNINFLIWCLMAIVEGSLIFFPNRCVCIAYSCSCPGRSVETLAHRCNKVGGHLQETHLRQTRKESPIARRLLVCADPIFGWVWNKPLPATLSNMGYRTFENNGSRIKRRSNSSGSTRQERRQSPGARSAFGPKPTCKSRRSMSAHRGEADVTQTSRLQRPSPPRMPDCKS